MSVPKSVRALLVCVSLLLVSGEGFGQYDMDNPLTGCSKYPDWYFSLNFGTTFSNVIYTGEIEGGALEGDFDYKTGFNVGLLFDFYLVKHYLGGDHNSYAIRTGLNYIRKGYEGDDIFRFTPSPNNDEPLISYKTHYDYLQVL